METKGQQHNLLRQMLEDTSKAPSNFYRGKTCNLCLTEKLHINKQSNDPNLLNSRDELLTKCRHKNKFKLKALTANTILLLY